MSYSFNIRAADKTGARERVAIELAKVCMGQPVHDHDAQQAEAAANAFIDLLPDDATRDVTVSVSGSIGWTGTTGEGGTIASAAITSTGVSVYASLAMKNPA